MNTSDLYPHKSLLGYFLSALRAGRVWRFCADIVKYVRRARLVRMLYRGFLAILFLVRTGATAALFLAVLVALIPLLAISSVFLLADHMITCLRWKTVLSLVFSCDRACYVFFCDRIPKGSFLLANAAALSLDGAVVLLVAPFREKGTRFRSIERIHANLFLVKPDLYFYIRRKFLRRQTAKNVYILSDFDISKNHYTTKGEGVSR